MLNLSDKDLDRLSKEAAQEYEPGEILGPNSWEKLAIRLDSDLGRVSPNPLRHIRRFPFYYAPALLVLLGISYYYLTKSPPSSRYTVKNSTTNQISTNSANSTPAVPSSANPTGPATSGNTATAVTADSAANSDATPVTTPASTPNAAAGSAPSTAGSAPVPDKHTLTSSSAGGTVAHTSKSSTPQTHSKLSAGTQGYGSSRDRQQAFTSSRTRQQTHSSRHRPQAYASGAAGLQGNSSSSTVLQTQLNAPQTHPAAQQSHELERSKIGGLSATKSPADISDSALRAFTLKSMPPAPIRRALYIKRNWQFGLIAAPDFASVNSLAGDKPGSTLGLTVDYQFAPRWYISSGLLLDRRNYAARAQDFHPSMQYYFDNHINPQHVDFAKGSFQMLEIPLNLRYDFSITGSTLFFASAGVSSFLFAADGGNCYVSTIMGEKPYGFKHPGTGNYLFSTMNLSLGVETGLSNSMSLLVAPYVKMPLGGIGFGAVQMSSVGITFGVKWAPVTSRRRR